MRARSVRAAAAFSFVLSVVAAVTNPPLRSEDWNPVAALGHCKGDCDTDADCEAGLECVQRSGWEGVIQCSGDATHNMDYCIDKERAVEVGWSPERALEHCHGDCDTDTDCRPGLYCYERKGGAALPLCGGENLPEGMDYCIDPNHVVDKGWTSVEKRKGLLEHCHGDCDQDDDCAPGKGLKCILRDGNVLPKELEVCEGAKKTGMDYCVNMSPVDCHFAEWGPWTTCTKSCKRGNTSGAQSAQRLVTPPRNGGIPCPESNLVPIFQKKWRSCNQECCPGMWAEEFGQKCEKHTECNVGSQWETVAATPTSDRECADHTECKDEEYETEAPGTHADRKCWPCTKGFKCDGTVALVPCRAEQRRFQDEAGQTRCKRCAACPLGHIRTGCGGASAGRCVRCPAGFRRVGLYACEVCPKGTFEVDGAECKSCTPGRFSMKGATACTSCAAGSYQPESEQGNCLPCTGGWTHTAGPALAGHNSERVPPSLLLLWKAKTAGHVGCTAYTKCSDLQYQTVEGGKTTDRECEDHTVCEPGEYASTVAGTHHDRVCDTHSICEPGQQEAWAPTLHNDRECEAPKVCSHVTCRHEKHSCHTHHAFKEEIAKCAASPFRWRSSHVDQTRFTRPCQSWSGENVCDHKAKHWSIRVLHHKAEVECKRGHICKMEGDQCVCKQRYMDRPDSVTCGLADSSGPSGKPLPSHTEACFRLCRATNDAHACVVAQGFRDTVRPDISMCAVGTVETPRHEDWELCKSTAMDGIDGDVTSAIRYEVTGPVGAQMHGAQAGVPDVDTVLCSECTFVAAYEIFARGFPGNYMVVMSVCDAQENCAKGAFGVVLPEKTSRLSCSSLAKFRSISQYDDDADVCASSYCDAKHSAFPDNGRKKSYSWAKAHCESVGARLCTFDELASCQTCNIGCSHDARLVWSSSSKGCDEGEHVMEVRRHESVAHVHFKSRRSCRRDDELVGAVRCCADKVGQESSRH